MACRLLPTSLLSASLAMSATYHIAQDGSDARSADQAKSETTPWRSFANLAGVAFQPGDSLLIRRGDTLRGTLRLGASGSQDRPIVIAGYGPSGSPPRIQGTIPVVGWTRESADVWKARVPHDHEVTRVFSRGIPLRNARLPDTGWLRTTGHLGDTSILAPATAGSDWTGASLLLWNLNWDLEGHRIKAQDGNRLILARKNGIALSDTALYALTNHPRALVAAGTWVYRASDSSLLYKGPQPADSALEAAVHSAGIDLRGAKWIQVVGIEVFGSADTGILSNGQGIEIADCRVNFADHVGIHLGGPDAVVRDCRVRGSSSAGITLRGKRGLAERDTVERVMVADWIGPNGMGASCCTGNGLNVWGDTSLARWNRVDSIGFNGIGFGGIATRVTENHASHFCMLANDCAGIYGGPQAIPESGSGIGRIWRNLVHDSHRSAWPWPWPAANGIYLDAHSHNAVVDSNVVWNVDKGFHGNNGSGLVYRDNLLYGMRYSPGDFANNDSIGATTPIGAIVENNLVVASGGSRTEFTRYIPQTWQSQAELLSRGNLVCEDQTSRILCRRDSLRIWTATTFDSSFQAFGRQTIPNGSFDSSVLAWRHWPSPLLLSLDSGSRCPTAHCLRVDWIGDTVAGSPYLGTGPVIRTDSGQSWWLSLRARSKRPGEKITAVLRRPTDYASLGPSFTAILDTIWQDLSFRFQANQRFDSARLDIHCPKKDSTLWLDEVLLRKDADSSAWASLGPRTTFLWNAEADTKDMVLPPGRWVDEKGVDAPSRVQIPSYSGKVFFRIRQDPLDVLPTNASTRTWWAIHREGRIVLGGLQAPAEIFDLRGRRLALIIGDLRGDATWECKDRRQVVWVRSQHRTASLLLER